MRKLVMASIFTASLLGCASTHDLNEGPSILGGGATVITQSDGSRVIISRSNYAPWPDYASAKATWKEKALQVCGDTGYTESHLDEDLEQESGFPPFMIQFRVTRSAIITCKSAEKSIEDK